VYNNSPVYDYFDEFDEYDFQKPSNYVSIKKYFNSFQRVFAHNCSREIYVHKVNNQLKHQIQNCLLHASIEKQQTSQATPSDIFGHQPRYVD